MAADLNDEVAPRRQAAVKSERNVAAIEHAWKILETFSEDAPFRGVNEIARMVNLDKSSVSRILKTLSSVGAVKQGVTGRYSLSVSLMRFAVVASASLENGSLLRGAMQRLSDETGETIQLATWDEDDVIIVGNIPSRLPVCAPGRTGERVPAHATAIGKVMLAFSDRGDDLLERLVISRHTENTITDVGQIATEIELTRRRGYASNIAEYADGVVGVAVPLFNTSGFTNYTLGIAGPEFRLSPERLAEMAEELRQIALELRGQMLPGLTQ